MCTCACWAKQAAPHLLLPSSPGTYPRSALLLPSSAGISAHQKLDLLSELVRLLGYESVTLFGDCFDEVTLLDPVRCPGAPECML